ncbi:MAG: MraY family glycosyltransferase [bacterium]
MTLILTLIGAAGLSVAVTALVRVMARHYGVLDRPGGRKRHGTPTPLLGGFAIYLSLVGAVVALSSMGLFNGSHIKAKYLVGIIAAASFLAFGGALDDRYDLKPWRQLIWPVLAVVAVIASGIGVAYVTNPFGGVIELNRMTTTVLWLDGIPYRLTLLADLFALAWLLTMTYTTKFLDGLDGLVSGVTVIGCLVVAAVSLTRDVAQPDTALLALAIGGVFAGFLAFNFHPARMFLGEGGSTLAGFLLGTLAIISGGKIATTLLVLGLPLFDAMVVVVRRLLAGRSPFGGDRSHLHFLLVDGGIPHGRAVLLYWFLSALFGISTLLLDGLQKMAAFALAGSLVLGGAAFFLSARKRSAGQPAGNDSDSYGQTE